jgi:hypothetical protein
VAEATCLWLCISASLQQLIVAANGLQPNKQLLYPNTSNFHDALRKTRASASCLRVYC